MKNDGINAQKRRRFVQEYALDYNGAAAAIRAGYSPRSSKVTASRLLANADIYRALRQIQYADAERLALSREAVIKRLQDSVELARVKADPKAMIAGLREIGKMLGYYDQQSGRAVIEPEVEGMEAHY